MKRQILALALAFFLIPAGVSGKGISDSGCTLYDSALKEEARESSFLFDDGFGRMVEFTLAPAGEGKNLIIRQNRQVVWQKDCLVNETDFSVVKREGLGRIYFLIQLGERRYHAFQDRDGRWQVQEFMEDPKGLHLVNDGIIPL